MGGTPTRFDAEAPRFDERAGVGDAHAAVIAAAAVELARAAPGRAVEIGPGTGEIGFHLAARCRAYAGIDASRPMLEAFARRRPPRAVLVQADARRCWPLRAATADLVFSSRAAHLLDPVHVAGEVLRVCRPGAVVLLGRVQRDREGLRARLRERRRRLLAEHGIAATEGEDRTGRLLDALVGRGATPLEPRSPARWTVTTSADAVVAHWESTATAGGKAIPLDVHAAVIAELQAGAADESAEEIETYSLRGARLP